MRKWIKLVLLAVVLLFFGLVVADSLGLFSSKPYTAVPHGNHVHYVPENRDPDVPLGQFPMTKPDPDEMITPEGDIVKKQQSNKSQP